MCCWVMRLGFRFEGKAFNFCGQTTLRETAKLLSCSRMVISGDTGIMHMAAALNKPMHVVWGSTAASFGMGPLMPDIGSSVVMHHWVGGLFCRPCSKLGYSSCPRGHFRCMREQDSGRWILL
jgi:ADP-heptose:LPS heptosyltransferase